MEINLIHRGIMYATVAVVVGALVWLWWPNDLRTVEKHTAKLLELVSKKGPESLPVGAARSIEAGSYLASNVVMRLGPPFPGSLRRSDAISLIQQGRMQADQLSVRDRGRELTRMEDGTIQADLTIDAEITYRSQTEAIIGTYRLIWTRGEDGWKVTRGEALNVIEHPAGLSM
jgi:hypothetical protein